MDASKISDFIRTLIRTNVSQAPVDSVSPGTDDAGENISSFTLTKNDRRVDSEGNGIARPVGQWVYTVTVHRSYVREGEED